jgi:predicted MPP superfamily phosphohydrolase
VNPFFLVALSVLGGGLLFLTHRLAFAPRWGLRWTLWAVPLVLVVMTGLSFLQFGSGATFASPDTIRPLVWLGATWLAFALYLLLGLVIVALVSWVWGRVGPRREPGQTWGQRRVSLRERRQRVNRWGVAIAMALAVAITGYGVVKADDPTITPMTVRSAQLPEAFDGTTVALITDLHAGAVRSADFTRKVVQRTNAAKPDLIVLSGDLIDGPVWRYGPTLEPLKDLTAPLGVFAVTGNHEMYSGTIRGWEDAWADLGVTVVSNKVVPITKDGQSIALGGVHDFSGVGEFAPDYDAATAGVSPGEFQMVLAHQPRQAFSFEGRGVDLQLSGHTHGGQLWPFRQLVLSQQPMIDGYAVVAGVPVVTSRGAGAWGPPVRTGADPQIPLITLARG